MSLIDQLERDRFIQEHGSNISVIAPAGVGKTRSIIERIVFLAHQPEAIAIDRLTRLIVVTYSVKAAQEMQQRARVAIREAKVSPQVQRAFQQTFFGTIHSYCVRLLDRFGHYLGLPSSVGLLQADDELWQRFLTRGLGQGMPADPNLTELFAFFAPDKLYALGKSISPGDDISTQPFPSLDLKKLLAYTDPTLHAATRKTITRAQEAALLWSHAWARGEHFRTLPVPPESAKAADFAQLWAESFAPLHNWLRDSAFAFGRRIANAYAAFRLDQGVMTYDDQVRMALLVLNTPAVQRELAADRLSVLLDEAQDTDPRQFEVLRRVAGLAEGYTQAADQSFCIVGDFQQAIYAPRSDLATYRRVDTEILADPRGSRSKLQVTFRCDQAIIDFVNRLFPLVLNNSGGQCEFVELAPRDNAGPGQVLRWPCPELPALDKITSAVRAQHEAKALAQQIQKWGPAGLGADSWSQVAILCPRKNWLLDLQRELVALDLPVQLHSSNEQQGDRTPGAWLTSLLWIAAHPEDTFEIAGVLREIFGVPDHDMAHFTGGKGERLRLDRAVPVGEGTVARALQILHEACIDADRLPLAQAVEKILRLTRLRERLNSIPDLELEQPDRELNDFLALIAARSAEGLTLAELAQELRLGLTQTHPAEEEIRDAIQLLTSHKSKGLEWQAVVVPYIFRNIESKSPTYPRLEQGPDGNETICRDATDYKSRLRDHIDNRDRQQLQRLLYVMSTRAKRTLLLVDDQNVYAAQKRRGGWSAAELLGLTNGTNTAAWDDLPTAPNLKPSPATTVKRIEPSLDLPNLNEEALTQALTRARAIPTRITPHTLAIHRHDEAEPETRSEREEEHPPSADNPGILYGTWWHEFVETLPWSQPRSHWQQRFLEAQKHSPQPVRSTREWELLTNSKLAAWLEQPSQIIHTEIPFLWHEANATCLEGIMDLAVYSPKERAWQVLDWKTNRVGKAGASEIVAIYREQIRAYVRTLRGLLKAEVRGSLYLTQTGEWIEVD